VKAAFVLSAELFPQIFADQRHRFLPINAVVLMPAVGVVTNRMIKDV